MGANVSRRNGEPQAFDGSADNLRVSPQRGNGGTSDEPAGMAEKYARGTLSIILKFDREPRLNFHKPYESGPACGWRKGITIHRSLDIPVWTYDVERGVASSPQDGRDFDVLIRIIQLAELVEVHTSTGDKGFHSLEGVFHPLAGCFYSIAGGFEVNPIVACRELEVAILCPVVNSDQFPRSMIEGGPQIVDSVAYYRGEVARKFFSETNANVHAPSSRIALDTKSVWFLCDERGELPFKIGNVVIGPLDFLFGAVEHA